MVNRCQRMPLCRRLLLSLVLLSSPVSLLGAEEPAAASSGRPPIVIRGQTPPAGVVVSDDVAAKPRNDLPGLANFAHVSAGLYRGARPTPDGFKTLAQLGIKTVVSLEAFHSDREYLLGSGMQYVHIPCPPIHVPQDQLLAFLKVATDPQCQPVFVHCQFGADRTGVMVAAYRRTVDGWSADQAVAEMQKFGHHNVLVTFVPIVRALDPDKTRQRYPLAVRPQIEIMR